MAPPFSPVGTLWSILASPRPSVKSQRRPTPNEATGQRGPANRIPSFHFPPILWSGPLVLYPGSAPAITPSGRWFPCPGHTFFPAGRCAGTSPAPGTLASAPGRVSRRCFPLTGVSHKQTPSPHRREPLAHDPGEPRFYWQSGFGKTSRSQGQRGTNVPRGSLNHRAIAAPQGTNVPRWPRLKTVAASRMPSRPLAVGHGSRDQQKAGRDEGSRSHPGKFGGRTPGRG